MIFSFPRTLLPEVSLSLFLTFSHFYTNFIRKFTHLLNISDGHNQVLQGFTRFPPKCSLLHERHTCVGSQKREDLFSFGTGKMRWEEEEEWECYIRDSYVFILLMLIMWVSPTLHPFLIISPTWSSSWSTGDYVQTFRWSSSFEDVRNRNRHQLSPRNYDHLTPNSLLLDDSRVPVLISSLFDLFSLPKVKWCEGGIHPKKGILLS